MAGDGGGGPVRYRLGAVCGSFAPPLPALAGLWGIKPQTTILFFIDLRFRLSFAPFVILSAASLLGHAPILYRYSSWRFWVALIILLVLYPFIPGLWLFILLYTGLALWPAISRSTLFSRLSAARLASPVSLLIAVSIYVFVLASGLRPKPWLRTCRKPLTITLAHPWLPLASSARLFKWTATALTGLT